MHTHSPSADADLFEIGAWADLLAAAPAPLARGIGLEVAEVGGATACVAPGLPTIEFNRAVGLGLRAPAREDDVGALLDFYRARGSKSGAIQTIQGALALEVESWLAARGSAPMERRWVVLVRDARAAEPVASRLRVVEIGRAHAAAAADAFCVGYGMPALMASWIDALVERPCWRTFCAFDADRVVATSFLFMHAGRAELAGAGTIPEFRGRGAQGAMLAARIDAARSAGARVLQSHTGAPLAAEASPSLDNMRRAGLTVLHERVNWSVTPSR